jgi:ferrous iron transport protein B
LFNVLSDIKSSTSNFAGTTVAVKESFINVNFKTYRLIDLPGTYSLNPSDKAEEVTLNFLMNQNVDMIINVVDSTILSRSLELTVELIELGLPLVIAMNMQDEAQRYGITIDSVKLQGLLNIPVVNTIGLFGKGVKELIETCDRVIMSANSKPNKLAYTHHIESFISDISEVISADIPNKALNNRFYSIKLIESRELLPEEFSQKHLDLISRINTGIAEQHKMDGLEAIAYERHHHAMKLTHEVSKIIQKKSQPLSAKLDNILLHPIFGYFFLALFFIIYFVAVFHIGTFIASVLDPLLQRIPSIYEVLRANSDFLWHVIDGVFQGFSGAIGIVLPYFIPLLLLTSIFEDTGYMSRIAFLLDGLFHKIGLHGKSVAPFVMGFGCTVPAIYATRIIENQRDRLITGILINFIPCSARLTVIFALSAAFTGPFWTALIFIFVLFVVAISGKILSIFLGKPTGLVMEMPNLKLPSLKATYHKTYFKVREFIMVAVPLLIAGSVVLSLLEYFEASKFINYAFSPLISFVLGLPEQLGSTLIFGFLRKELVIVMAYQAMGTSSVAGMSLTTAQAVVFTIFVILYIPCVSTFVVIWKEFGGRIIILTSLISIFLAIFSALLFKIILY